MDIRLEAQSISSALEHGEENMTEEYTKETSLFDMVPPAPMAGDQQKDSIFCVVYQYIAKGI